MPARWARRHRIETARLTLWNSGDFLFHAATMLGEIERFEPAMAEAAKAAVAGLTRDLDFLRLASEPSPLRRSIQADRQALPSGSHAERPVQGSRRQEYWAADAGGPRAEQAGKVEARLLLSRIEGGTVARAGGNTCGPLSARLDLKGPAVPRSDTDHTEAALTG
jgi:hypothetical protein